MHLWAIAATAFLASAVEAVEAATIVLAVGYASGWRTALGGAAWALLALVVMTGLGGPALLHFVPLPIIRLAVGAFLLWFGFGWLRKAVLRYAGHIPMRDERAAFDRHLAALRDAAERRTGAAVAFNGVFLEGVEVAIVVVTVGSASSTALGAAGAGALGAFLAVAIAAIVMRRPFARIPENTMKFAVGVMLVTFGTFWLGEGIGAGWPLGNAMLPVMAVCYAAVAALIIFVLRARTKHPHHTNK
jgi:uncharacterized membrane protein